MRVGTHGLKASSKTTLWNRLKQHHGSSDGGGNQRGSVFRRHVGRALMAAALIDAVPGWDSGSSASAAQREAEKMAEAAVSRVIRAMSVLWFRIEDEPGSQSQRGYIERNAIALLTSTHAKKLDPPSETWLGRHAPAPEIRESGLWNVNHVGGIVDPVFLDRFSDMVGVAI